jgi:hypothetical protein
MRLEPRGVPETWRPVGVESSFAFFRSAILENRSFSERNRQDEQDSEMEEEELTEKIIGCAMKVHSVFGKDFIL